MTVRITKPEFNLREKITELDKPTGLKGNELMRSETAQEVRDLVSAGRKNLIINGDMRVAQRGTSSTDAGYQTVDRFSAGSSVPNENPTRAQVDVASGTTPYTLGFRKAFRITNGNQTSGVQNGSEINVFQNIEAQDIVQSGWDYTSGSSFITWSFWIKSSVATNFYGYLRTYDNTAQGYAFETGSLSANTWTKIIKKIPGNSNIDINNDNGVGLQFRLLAYIGTSYSDNSRTFNTWAAYSSSARVPEPPTTWFTTNDATLEMTGWQVEVGPNATEFEHRSYGEELALCKRYYQQIGPASSARFILSGAGNGTARIRGIHQLSPEMRIAPDVDIDTSSENPTFYAYNGSPPGYVSKNSMESTTKNFHWDFNTGTHNQQGDAFDVKGSGAFITIDAEL